MNDTAKDFWKKLSDRQSRITKLKDTILGELRKTGKNFDEVDVWQRIEQLAKAAIAPEFAKEMETNARERRKRFQDIAKTSRHLRELIGTEKSMPDLFSELAGACWDRKSAERPGVGQAERKLTLDLEFLAILEHGATYAPGNHPVKPGRPLGPLCGVIIELANVYRRATGKKAGTDTGPYERFVSAFLKAIGQERSDVVDLIKNCMKNKSKKKSNRRKSEKAALID